MQSQQDTCHEMNSGEVLNASHAEYPLHEALIYGDRISCAKFSKRLSCAIKHLPIRVRFSFEHNTQKALDAGITKDPTLTLNSQIFLEGLVQAEIITQAFERLLQ